MSECAKLPKNQCNPPNCMYVNKTRKYCRKATSKKQCNGLPENQCLPPECSYINTSKRRYCRRSNKRAVIPVSHPVAPAPDTRKITNMIRRSSMFLSKKCELSGDCLAFGKYADELNHLFKNFSDFSLAKGYIKSIGANSANGFIREIKYEKNGYTAHAILKSNQEVNSDNLGYEYVVGKHFVNTIIKQFPCFLYTYGLYYYNSTIDYNAVKYSSQYTASNLSKSITVSTIDYEKMCKYPKHICILVQHLHSSVPIIDKIFSPELLHILFIIYHALHNLRERFTHYDLHENNVLLFQLPPGQCIKYIYHFNDGTSLSFKTTYVPKIIDYGRCYFNAKTNSQKIKDILCASPSCTPLCGYSVGFSHLNDGLKKYHIQTEKSNQSHDLRLLHILKPYLDAYKHNNAYYNYVFNLLSKVVYTDTYGTNEHLNSIPGKIMNITDAYENLKEACKHYKDLNENLTKNYVVEQTIHVYENGKEIEYE